MKALPVITANPAVVAQTMAVPRCTAEDRRDPGTAPRQHTARADTRDGLTSVARNHLCRLATKSRPFPQRWETSASPKAHRTCSNLTASLLLRTRESPKPAGGSGGCWGAAARCCRDAGFRLTVPCFTLLTEPKYAA